jgi:uncharacterized protein (DUF697 family)
MSDTSMQKAAALRPQGLVVDQFFYFFLRLRKGEVRRMVSRVRSLYPGESRRKLARRLINAQSVLSFAGGALLHLPRVIPAAGHFLKMAGMVGGSAALARMQLYLILEIAELYGQDIDDQARVGEMLTVLAASGVPATAGLWVDALSWEPATAIPLAGLTATALTQATGEAAIRFYEAKSRAADAIAATATAAALP